ncbi:MAG: OB-fold nucleic acid binding domain-containing protein [Candidatus Woesearchaeota archaeon]
MEEPQKRQVAYKVWISDLINHDFIRQSGEWDPNYVQIGNKKISRVNIIATVIEKSKADDGSYASLIIDDGSENVSVKAWKEDIKLIENVEIGTAILLIGRVREYNEKIYLSPEIVKPLDKLEWVELRKKELLKEYGTATKFEEVKTEQPIRQVEGPKEILVATEEEIVEDITTESDRQKILNDIEKLHGEDGVETEKVISNTDVEESRVRSIIQELLKEGEIFEISPGKIKIIE